MTAFAEADDLATLLGITFTTAQQAQAELALDLASAAIREYTRQQIDRSVTVDRLAGCWEQDLRLPQYPVNAVLDVAINDIHIDPSGYFWNKRQHLRRGMDFTINEFDFVDIDPTEPMRQGATGMYRYHWDGPRATVTVTNDHGYDIIPEEIRAICLQAASRCVINPFGLQSERLGAYDVRYTRFGSGGLVISLDADEEGRLRRWRKYWELAD